MTGNGRAYGCGKLDPQLRAIIDERSQAGTMTSKGDNCEGKSYEQGL